MVRAHCLERSLERFVERFERFERFASGVELELELIQSQMAQKPMLRGEVGVQRLPVALRLVLETSDDSVGIEARAATSVMVLRRQGPTLLSTEHCRYRLSVMVLRRQGERRMQLPR